MAATNLKREFNMQKVTFENPKSKSIPVGGLSALEQVKLGDPNQRLLDAAHDTCGGPAVWRYRKLAETYELLALSEIAPRFKVELLDLREALRVVVLMQVSVPCQPDATGNPRIVKQTRLGIKYPEEIIRMPVPGFSIVEIIQPKGVWHANVSFEGAQMLCLGAQIPAGIQLKEIILMTYGALCLQTVMIDEMDAAGVLNPEAARWWQHSTKLIPLSWASFLENHRFGAEQR
jgi:hypothetical protein